MQLPLLQFLCIRGCQDFEADAGKLRLHPSLQRVSVECWWIGQRALVNLLELPQLYELRVTHERDILDRLLHSEVILSPTLPFLQQKRFQIDEKETIKPCHLAC